MNGVVKSGVAIVPLGAPGVCSALSAVLMSTWLRLDSSSLAAGIKRVS